MKILTRRPLVPVVLVLLLAVASAAVSASTAGPSAVPRGAHALPSASPAGLVLDETSLEDSAYTTPAAQAATPRRAVPPAVSGVPAATPKTSPKATPATSPKATPKPSPKARTVASSGTSAPATVRYTGRNHVWIPALHINRTVYGFSCSRTRPPDNLVYRWGCAGSNNVYLMGHAAGVFKALHDAYVGGHLRVGMKAYYADARGTVHVYAVKWWKLTRPTTSASWAWASQAVPSMTLQTCVGKNNAYRLMVRLVEVDR